ncbi:hypothetical protein KC357_g61 [Hortaea werneckii]|nr:hypothetical protein KC357_g61 [Hortaea werneckii]
MAFLRHMRACQELVVTVLSLALYVRLSVSVDQRPTYAPKTWSHSQPCFVCRAFLRSPRSRLLSVWLGGLGGLVLGRLLEHGSSICHRRRSNRRRLAYEDDIRGELSSVDSCRSASRCHHDGFVIHALEAFMMTTHRGIVTAGIGPRRGALAERRRRLRQGSAGPVVH